MARVDHCEFHIDSDLPIEVLAGPAAEEILSMKELQGEDAVDTYAHGRSDVSVRFHHLLRRSTNSSLKEANGQGVGDDHQLAPDR